ncbi:MAG: hypothetical protein PHP99_07195 [Paludibacter sp.]|jgi:uncharacterized protein YxjI|nr:hypothetical protein [Paludibacter sp.]MDD3490670.1 hypothetical protein [Paludibacter sp.]
MQFPLQLTFKVTTLSNDFVATDANGNTVAYVRQKMLRLLEEVQVFSNENRSELNYTIRANRWLDFNSTYTFTNRMGYEVGRIVRKGWASLWKAHYEIFDEKQQSDLIIREENPWAKVFDNMLGEIPLLGVLSGYLFHPAYIVTRPNGTEVVRLTKQPSFWGRKFTVDKLSSFEAGEEERIVLGLMMMILLERQRG